MVTAAPNDIRRKPLAFAPGGVAIMIGIAVGVALVSLVPLAFVVWVAVDSGWDMVRDLVFRPKVVDLLVNTALLIGLTLPIAIVLAVALAWFVERSNLPFARIWSWILVAPLAVPAFVHSYAWSSLAPGFHGLWSAVLISILAYLPFLYLPVAAQLRRLDATLEETASLLGKRPVGVFFSVVLPQLRLAICGGSLLVGLHLLAEYGLFVLTRFDTFATAIVDQFQAVYNGPAANLLGGVLVLTCLALVQLEMFLRGDERYARIGSGAARTAARTSLGRWRWPACTLLFMFALLTLGVPTVTLARWLVIGGAGIWHLDFIGQALWQTAFLSLIGAMLTTAAAFPMAWLSIRRPDNFQKLLEAGHYYVGALPGVIVALALVAITVRFAQPLYQTVFTLLLAYVLMFLPRALIGLRASIAQAPVELERAAASLGKPPLLAIWRTTMRLAAPGAAASAALVALGIANELTGTLMLAPNGTRTLAMRFWSYSSELNYAAAAPYAALMIALSLPLVLLLRLETNPDRIK
jgi:iron(III) transport system permease protein